jgi:hypothetical protein
MTGNTISALRSVGRVCALPTQFFSLERFSMHNHTLSALVVEVQ